MSLKPTRSLSSCKGASTRCVSACATPAQAARRRTVTLGSLALLASTAASSAYAAEFASSGAMTVLQRRGEYALSDAEWREKLSGPQYSILREANTERPFVSPLNKEKRAGTFTCSGCGAGLFDASTKFDSGTGWPSFYQALPKAVDEVPDNSIFFLPRTEVRCHRCQGHLGHVFDDGPKPTGKRFCMNGYALAFEPKDA